MTVRFCLALALTSFLFSCQSYKELHKEAIVIDTHNDVLSGVVMKGLSIEDNLRGKSHSDLARFRRGGVDAQVFSVFCDERFGKDTAFKYANIEIDSLEAIAARNPNKMILVKNPGQLQMAVRQQKLGALIGVEGGHMIENNLQYLDSLFDRGARYLTLTWNNSTPWASSAMDESRTLPASASYLAPAAGGDAAPALHKGLNDFGKQVVRRMNELGMMVDVSHVGEQTFWDVLNTTTKPVIASHSSCYALCPVFRNLTDEQIKAIGKNGGVVFLNFYSGFLDSSYLRRVQAFHQAHQTQVDSLKTLNWASYSIDEWMAAAYPREANALRPPLSLLMDHLDHVVKLIGVRGVGLGSDFDGISSAPKGLDDVTAYPLITQALRKRGYSKKQVKMILGGNFIRVFRANMLKTGS